MVHICVRRLPEKQAGAHTPPVSQPIPPVALIQPVSAKVHYLLTGTFNTVFLYLLAFNPTTSSLSIHAKVEGEGPHQFWALNARRDRAYATTWGAPASLSAWEVLGGGRDGIQKINTVPISACLPVQVRRRADAGPHSGDLVLHPGLADTIADIFCRGTNGRGARGGCRDRWVRDEAAGAALRSTGGARRGRQDESGVGAHVIRSDAHVELTRECCRGTEAMGLI